MKKIFLLLIINSILFADIYSDLNTKKDVYFKYNNKKYSIDKTCELMDIKKLISIQNDLLTKKESKSFYLNICSPFKYLYNLNKKVSIRDYDVLKVRKSMNKLALDFRNSFYIQFYTYIYARRHSFEFQQNFEVFNLKNDVYSKYVNIYLSRKLIGKKKKEDYYTKINKEGKYLLKSKENIIYTNVAKDITYYLEREGKKIKLEKFLLYRIKENNRRGLDNQFTYLKLANFYFDKIYMTDKLDTSIVKDNILQSYKYGKVIEQVKLFMKMDVREHYLKLLKSYPKYIDTVSEFDLLKKEIENLERYRGIVDKKNYYLNSLKSLVYEKYLYLKYSDNMRDSFKKSLYYSLEKEKDINKKRRISNKIELLKEKKFFK